VTPTWPARRAELAREIITALYREGMLKTWLRDRPQGWELVSGLWSPFYVSLREVPSRPELFRLVAGGLGELLRNEVARANRLLGVASTGVPIAAAVAYAEGLPMGFTRKLPGVRDLADLDRQVRAYGGHALVEGEFAPGDQVAIIDDVVSLFGSKEVAIRQLRMELSRRGVEDVGVAAVLTVVDRGRNTQERAAAAGVTHRSLVSLYGDGLDMLAGVAAAEEIAVLRDYLEDAGKYQDPDARAALLP
jgi:orotate phosphoribosyltransferase